jgi:hypothetical protein
MPLARWSDSDCRLRLPVRSIAFLGKQEGGILATQRITLAKIGGLAADIVERQFREWSNARKTARRDKWSSDQWPTKMRREADRFANRLRANSLTPPVVHFVEWVDMWSMFDVFDNWLTPPGGEPPLCMYGNKFELYCYPLADQGQLARHVADPGEQQFVETDRFIAEVRDAIASWDKLVDRAVLVLVRWPVDVCVTDEQLTESLSFVPEWLLSFESKIEQSLPPSK